MNIKNVEKYLSLKWFNNLATFCFDNGYFNQFTLLKLTCYIILYFFSNNLMQINGWSRYNCENYDILILIVNRFLKKAFSCKILSGSSIVVCGSISLLSWLSLLNYTTNKSSYFLQAFPWQPYSSGEAMQKLCAS